MENTPTVYADDLPTILDFFKNYQGSDQQTETSHPPLGPGLVPGPQLKGFPLELFTFSQTLKIQPLYLYII